MENLFNDKGKILCLLYVEGYMLPIRNDYILI